MLLLYNHDRMRNVTHTVHYRVDVFFCACVCVCCLNIRPLRVCLLIFIAILGLWSIAVIISTIYEHKSRCTQ